MGNEKFRQAGTAAQRKSVVLLKNNTTGADKLLPLQGRLRIYVENIAADVANSYGQVVVDVADADVAILRLSAPYEGRGTGFESMFHRGDLRFPPAKLARILQILHTVPTIIDIYLDRPAVIPEIAQASAALLANFGASAQAVLNVVFGRLAPQGKLPFELPSSMEAVLAQKPDVPYDSEHPLYRFGHGLSY